MTPARAPAVTPIDMTVETDRTAERLPQLPASALSDEQRRAVEEFSQARGDDIRGPFIPLLRSPRLLTRTRAVGDYLRFQSLLPADLKELAILLTAQRWTQSFIWNAHYALCERHGLPLSVADDIRAGARPQGMSHDQVLVYDFCRELLEHCAVGDEAYSAVFRRFGESGVIDLTALVGYYTSLSMILNVARTSPDLDPPASVP